MISSVGVAIKAKFARPPNYNHCQMYHAYDIHSIILAAPGFQILEYQSSSFWGNIACEQEVLEGMI